MLSENSQRELLQLARATVLRHLGSDVQEPQVGPQAQQPQGAFVSLHTATGHELRGCIGTFAFDRPLAENVRAMALACATQDPRFAPVRLDELDGLRFEISAMTPPLPIAPADVVIGTHGLTIARGSRRGVLLPQVAIEWGFSREDFLIQLCRKAGLADDAWQTPGTDLKAFTAQVFHE